MKILVSILSLGLVTLLTVSCVSVRAGAYFGNEKQKSSFDDFSTNTEGIQHRDPNATRAVEFNTNTSKTGFYVGVFFSDVLPLGDRFDVQPEVNFVGITDLNQIQAPILARITVVDKFNIYAGPNFGYLLDTPAGLNSFNMGADFGVSYDILDNLLIESRYTLGISNLLENGDSNNSVKFSGFTVGAGYRF